MRTTLGDRVVIYFCLSALVKWIVDWNDGRCMRMHVETDITKMLSSV